MPLVQDAQVLLTGTVIALDPVTKFVDGHRTDEVEAFKVTVIAGDGIAIVKLTCDQAASLAPIVGDRLAWSVRCVPYAVGDNSGMTVKFVRLVDFGDIDGINSVVQSSAKASVKS